MGPRSRIQCTNFNTINYLNTNAFESPDSSPTDPTYTTGTTTEPWTTYKDGATSQLPLRMESTDREWWDVDLGIRRTSAFARPATLHLTFQIEADVSNATNSTFFNVGSLGYRQTVPLLYQLEQHLRVRSTARTSRLLRATGSSQAASGF